MFRSEYKVIVRNVQAKKFELRIKITQLDQEDRKSIIEYLKRISKLVCKITNNNDRINVGIIMLRNIKNQFKRNQVNFEYNKTFDYFYNNVNRLIKAIYSKIEKSNLFELDFAIVFFYRLIASSRLIDLNLNNLN